MCLKTIQKISSPTVLFLVFVISEVVVGMAYMMEHYGGVRPCQMCLYERDVFLVAGWLALFCLLLPHRFQGYSIKILGLIFAGGALLAGYHVMIQQHWVGLPSFCSTTDFSAFDTVESLREQLQKTPLVRCDQVTWRFLGLSLAGYNTLLSLCLVFFCWGWGWKRKRK